MSVGRITVALKPNALVPNQNSLRPRFFRVQRPFYGFHPLKKARIKCSFEYRNDGFSNTSPAAETDGSFGGVYEYERYASHYPKPSEIPWRKELCNTVNLIGNVGAPVQIKHLPSGKSVAWSRLAVRKSQTETIWIGLTFWDELASIAFHHVEKGQQIYVNGRLSSDTVEGEDGKQVTYYKVVVQELNFIEKGNSPVSLYDGGSSDYSTPSKKQNYSRSVISTDSVEKLWQAYFANPSEWWDNRKNKRSPNYPDFKHKDTGEALWVEGRNNPSWVKSQLAVLDSKLESYNGQGSNSRVSFMTANDMGLF